MTAAAGPPVRMVREHLGDLPRHDVPDGFRLRGITASRHQDWLAVQRDAEPYLRIDDELFAQQFGDDASAIAERCLLLEAPDGTAIGTISAWWGVEDARAVAALDADAGRIHWVAIRPAWQGRGLAKPLLAAALHRLARWHQRAWLATQAARLPAISLYARFGFQPLILDEADAQLWRTVARQVPALSLEA